MRFRRPLDDLLGTRTAVRVLRALARFPRREATGRQLAAEALVDPSNANAALRRLQDHGLVEVRGAGRARLWKLAERNVLAVPLLELFGMERRLLDLVRDALARHLAAVPGIRRATVFGSVARGDERPASDVDVLVVVGDGVDKDDVGRRLAPVRDLVRSTFGNPPTFVIYSEREARAKRNLPLMRNVEREGLPVAGEGALRTENVARARAGVYLRKAQEFLAAMRAARQAGQWNAVGLTAVHAVISGADAVTVRFLELRSRGPGHEEAVELLRRLPVAGVEDAARTFLEVVRAKGLVEYEDRLFAEDEALATGKKAERFLRWALEVVRDERP